MQCIIIMMIIMIIIIYPLRRGNSELFTTKSKGRLSTCNRNTIQNIVYNAAFSEMYVESSGCH